MALIRITRHWDGFVLYETEAVDMRAALVKAVASGANLCDANLTGAYLTRANLTGADLTRANLTGAYLTRANLTGAYLTRANLTRADLTGAYLTRASLTDAYLTCANLYGADLTDADLTRASLTGAYLTRANLYGANLFGASGIQPERCTPLLMLLEQPGPIRLYKLVTAEGVGPFNGGITYEVGQSYEVKDANTDVTESCGAGINVATLDWCLRNWREGYRVLIVECEPKDIAAIPTATDGKIRLHRCRVVAEKDISALVAPPKA